MRLFRGLLTFAITILLIWTLNRPWGKTIPMPLGSFLSPQTGFWQNAEDVHKSFNQRLDFSELKGKVNVYLDSRLVPHVFAEHDEDLYFVQGYLHAKFRLFQMDLQTRAAEGRISEIAGAGAIAYDKEQRRLGMKLGAEHALLSIEKNPGALKLYSAYTAGVNAFIHSLKKSEFPVEYKILNVEPEEWSNLRTALLLQMMAKMLSSGTAEDLTYTNLKTVLTHEQLQTLFPQVQDSTVPIVPRGTFFPKPRETFRAPDNADSVYFHGGEGGPANVVSNPNPDNGSNNWALAGSKTASGYPLLCNDPHLELSLPSIWYEMQLSTPGNRTYGVSLPGSPFIVIGFNDSIAWGVTNSQRDVKDYYRIRFRDKSRREYWYEHEWRPAQQRIEEIRVKSAPAVFDTVSYTVFGPVIYDGSFGDDAMNPRHEALAVKWVAHELGDEGYPFYQLNHARNYDDYLQAIRAFDCPGQNFVFASKSGHIAIWQQGRFPNRWYGQGLYVMPGEDSSYRWQGFIPQEENPHAVDPAQGYLFSANQRPADWTYPYFIPGLYITARAQAIDRFLSPMRAATVNDMMKLQNNVYNIMAEEMLPILFSQVDVTQLKPVAYRYYQEVKKWNLLASPESRGQTIYQTWFDSLRTGIWRDELEKAGPPFMLPSEQTTMEILKRDPTAYGFVDNKNTPEIETLREVVTASLNKASEPLAGAEIAGKLSWAAFKQVTIYHLLREDLMPFGITGLDVGGWRNTINAVTDTHGPSWRMIVQLSSETEAYGVYPGGQSGNPGSRYYDNSVSDWAGGKYYRLWLMNEDEWKDPRVKFTMSFSGVAQPRG